MRGGATKIILRAYQVVLALFPLNHLIFAILVRLKDFKSHVLNTLLIARYIQIVLEYIIILITYKMLFNLKLVEIQMRNQSNQDIGEIIRDLKKQKFNEKLMMIVFTFFLTMMLTVNFFLLFEMNQIFILVSSVIMMMFFFVNLYTILLFTRMGFSYVKLLRPYNINQRAVKILVVLSTVWTLITLARFLVFDPIWYIVHWHEVQHFNFS